MFKKLGFIDIETIPPGKIEDYVLDKEPPKTLKKEEAIQAWIIENTEKKYRDQAKNPKLAEIVCLCFSLEDKKSFNIETPNSIAFYGDNEKELLTTFSDFLEENLAFYDNTANDKIDGDRKDAPLTLYADLEWVGYNIRKYDLEAIWFKSIKYELYFLAKLIARTRFDTSVFDLMEKLQGPNSMEFLSFDKAMKMLDLGSKTVGMDGSKVYDAYMNGELETKIVPYCIDDILGNRKQYDKIYRGLR